MNRLILVGNGFDLAKGLKSGYKDFIDWMWINIVNTMIEKKSFSIKDDMVTTNSNLLFVEAKKVSDYETCQKFISENHISINYNNEFFKTISKQAYSNWVDIETEYFNEIKNILLKEKEEAQKSIEKLNANFEKIKLELENYLNSQLADFDPNDFDFTNLSESFNLLDFTSKGVDEFEKEYEPKMNLDEKNLFYSQKNKIKLGDYFYCKTATPPKNVLFLNFNYTDLIPKLIKEIKINAWKLDDWANSKMEYIYIHGELSKERNPIIFGYGDENDEIQSKIEKQGGDFLNNIKTINYLKTPNYKKVLSFLDSNNYQVFIMGHSCGLSDKTLLKTIFEHPNCISIRPFYYIDKKGNNNYDDIVKNIYRTFTDKALMRDKVVNQKYCCELKV